MPVANVNVGPERYARLAQIAAHHGYDSVIAYLDAFIRSEMKALGLDRVPPPGWDIIAARGPEPVHIAIGGPGLPVVCATPREATAIVSAMRDVLADRRKRGTVRTTVGGEQFVEVDRKGTGYRLHVTTLVDEPNPKVYVRAMPAAVLDEIANCIENVINEGQA